MRRLERQYVAPNQASSEYNATNSHRGDSAQHHTSAREYDSGARQSTQDSQSRSSAVHGNDSVRYTGNAAQPGESESPASRRLAFDDDRRSQSSDQNKRQPSFE